MSDAFSRSGGSSRLAEAVPPYAVKRPCLDFEMPSVHVSSHYARDSELAGHHDTRDTCSVNSLYERYLHSEPITSYGGESGISVNGLDGLPEITDLRILLGSGPIVAGTSQCMGVGGAPGRSEPALPVQSQFVGLGMQPEILLPHDASCTLFVQGVPVNCTRREASHIFRPFVGFKEVRLVKKSRQSGDDPWVLCFVDFQSPTHAAAAMDALQGYIFDEHDRDSFCLRLEYARSPGARSGARGVHYGKQ